MSFTKSVIFILSASVLVLNTKSQLVSFQNSFDFTKVISWKLLASNRFKDIKSWAITVSLINDKEFRVSNVYTSTNNLQNSSSITITKNEVDSNYLAVNDRTKKLSTYGIHSYPPFGELRRLDIQESLTSPLISLYILPDTSSPNLEALKYLCNNAELIMVSNMKCPKPPKPPAPPSNNKPHKSSDGHSTTPESSDESETEEDVETTTRSGGHVPAIEISIFSYAIFYLLYSL